MKGACVSVLSLFILLACFFIHSCDVFFTGPLEIVTWTPTEKWVTDLENCTVSVTFSREPDRVRTEEAFSIAVNGVQPPGRIRWEGRTMLYVPYHPPDEGKEYIVRVTTGAEDIFGNSLNENFTLIFFTGEEGSRPVITETDPSDLAEITDIYQALTLTFDTSIDIDSFLSSFSLTPSVKGTWAFRDNNSECIFSPTEPYTRQEEYTLTISEDLRSSKGYYLAEPFASRFRLWNEQERPSIFAILAEDSGKAVVPSPSDSPDIIVNSEWEKESGLRVVFSEEVERKSAESSLVVTPDIPFTVTWDDCNEFGDMIISWNENLNWRILYRVEFTTILKDKQGNTMDNTVVCYLYVNGPASSPPRIARVEFVPDQTTPVIFYDSESPENNENSHIILNTSSGMDVTQDPFYMDFYITLADEAELPFFSFVENFSVIPENSCVSIQYLDFQIFNPDEDLSPAALPKPTPNSNQAVVRFILSLTDAWEVADTVSFRVYDSLEDSLGNRMEEDWLWELFDEDN